ncbi:MAG: hypothetical protein NTW95_09620 [Candidatus Aminicenantes bacterium]|nr:hypothetical protein [Candidatus Aminicenantes bacterium]
MLKKLLALGTLVAFSFLVLFNDYVYSQAETPLSKAQALFFQGKYNEAVQVLDIYIGEIKAKPEQKSNLAAAWYLLANIYYEVGDDPKCDEALLKVFSTLPGFDRDASNYGFRERVMKAKAQLAGNLPVAAETTTKPVIPQKKSEPKTVEQQPKVEPQAVEMPKQGASAVVKKKKKFPLLLVILGVGAVVVLIVLLTKKKKLTLTVNLGVGTIGFPGVTTIYTKGQVINYSYSSQADYGSLQVKLDNAVVSASGFVTMDRDHVLDVSAIKLTLTVSSPNGGEKWRVGTNHNITWASTGSIANVKIEYSTNNGSSWNLISGSSSNNGNYTWTVPNALSSTCLVLVSNIANTAVNDRSDNAFLIIEPPSPPSVLTLYNGESYDFSNGSRGYCTGGDFYYSSSGSGFWSNNFGQRGIIDLGPQPGIALEDISIPSSGYTRNGVAAIVNHVYVSLAMEGEEGHYIVFIVTSLTTSSCTIAWLYR